MAFKYTLHNINTNQTYSTMKRPDKEIKSVKAILNRCVFVRFFNWEMQSN